MDLTRLRLAVDMSFGEETFDQVMEKVDSGHYQLGRLEGTDLAIVFTVIKYQSLSRLRILYAGGSEMERDLPKLVDFYTSMAKAMGLDGIELIGRKGWERIFNKMEGVKYRSFMHVDFNRSEED